MSSIIYGCDSNFDPHVAISDTFKTKLKGVDKRSRKSPQGCQNSQLRDGACTGVRCEAAFSPTLAPHLSHLLLAPHLISLGPPKSRKLGLKKLHASRAKKLAPSLF